MIRFCIEIYDISFVRTNNNDISIDGKETVLGISSEKKGERVGYNLYSFIQTCNA